MRINTFEWHDTATGWHLHPLEFFPFTLLVGPSGAGKTKILRAIIHLQRIIMGQSLNGITWDIDFSLKEGAHCRWTGKFENIPRSFTGDEHDTILGPEDGNKPELLTEELYYNGELLIERRKNQIRFKDSPTPKLSSHQSVLYHLREEDLIAPLYNEFFHISLQDQTESRDSSRTFRIFDSIKLAKKYTNLADILNSREILPVKLFLVNKHCPDIFGKIEAMFRGIFPAVEKIKIAPMEESDLPRALKNYPFIQLKEKGVEKWIDQREISSGMFSTLMHLCQIMLSTDGSVILIDEFENSLGVNCLNDIMAEILSSQRDLQFIITSHHPYIINEIDHSRWKIVTRKGGDVRVKNAGEFNIGKSKHEAFLQLINLPEFTDGMGG